MTIERSRMVNTSMPRFAAGEISMSEWYIVRTQSRAEERAVWNLNNQGFETYLPRYRKSVRHARKTKTVLCPLFPGYVFVQVNIKRQHWRSINGTFGVISIVQFGDGPTPIDAAIVDSIRIREDEPGIVNIASHGLKKGDRVRVCDGAFADYTALLEDISDSQRVFLLLDIMGREVRLNVPMGNLTKAS